MTIMVMSPEVRVKNSYESLYYYLDSNDPETDDIVRDQIQKAFADHDVLLSDRPSKEILREVMLDAYKEALKELGGSEPTELQIKTVTSEFDRFTKDRKNFYDVTYEMYETKYQGDSVDLAAEYERTVQDSDRMSPLIIEQNSKDIQSVKYDSKLSYMGHVPQASVPAARHDYEPADAEMNYVAEDTSNQEHTVNNEVMEINGPEL